MLGKVSVAINFIFQLMVRNTTHTNTYKGTVQIGVITASNKKNEMIGNKF
jgi:hypothetical protein